MPAIQDKNVDWQGKPNPKFVQRTISEFLLGYNTKL
jgi:hypothetical protein